MSSALLDAVSAAREARTLKPGDSYTREGVRVVILSESEPCRDRFGIERFRFWARREDSGKEGWVMFGEGGVVV